MQSKATTVNQYLAEMPEDRRQAIQAVRSVLLDSLDGGFEEGMQYGMIGYFIPHSHYPAGYHCDPKQPLPFAGLASQKNYMSLYLMSVYGEGDHWSWFREAWAKTGKKLDMGKCCIRFRKVEDLALDVIAEAVRRTPAAKYIEFYENALRNRTSSSRNEPAALTAKKTAKVGSRAKPGSKSVAPRKTTAKKSASKTKGGPPRKIK